MTRCSLFPSCSELFPEHVTVTCSAVPPPFRVEQHRTASQPPGNRWREDGGREQLTWRRERHPNPVGRLGR